MPPGTHARLSPSGAHRWMKCAGAPRMEAQMPPEGGSSIHAIEGTAAHELAEWCLRNGESPHAWVGDPIAVDEKEWVEVTQEMADAVNVFVEYVRDLSDLAEVHLEKRVSLAPVGDTHGTADALLWFPHDRTLVVADYKHGQGVVVEAERNPQLRMYALMAILTLRVKPDRVITTIVQPRAEHPDGPIREAEITWPELVAFRDELVAAIEAANDPEAPVGPVGSHCRFCRAKAICPAQRGNALVVAQSEFDAPMPTAGLPVPEALNMDQLTEVLEKAPYVEDWFKAVREFARTELEQGREVPGYKLVAKRATRRWTNDADAEAFLRKSKKLKVDQVAPRKLISPAQAEKLVKDLPEHLVESRSSGHNLAPDSNPRPAITPGSDAADEFDVSDS